ncbi:hypothetical protein L6R50_17510 [Myxococcota bacterium]|nr:hypothetical protein [Myxococcota bacterium]
MRVSAPSSAPRSPRVRRAAAGTLALAALAAPPAGATTAQLVWEYDFAAHVAENFSGTDGWSGGYGADPWTTAWFGEDRELNPRSDEGGGSWGSGQAIDNHMLATTRGPWRELAYEISLVQYDDDAAGIVFGYQNSSSFYLFFYTEGQMPGTGAGAETEGRGYFLYKVTGGTAVLLDDNSTARLGISTPGGAARYNRLRCEFERGHIRCAVNTASETGGFDSSMVVVEADDASFFPAGRIGVWSYQSGSGQGLTGFRDPKVWLLDTDEDGVVNDADCGITDPTVYPGAEDVADGVDNDCDGETDEDATDPGDDDTDPGDDDTDPGDDDTDPGDDDTDPGDDDTDPGDDDAAGDDDDAADDDAADDDAAPPGGDDDGLDPDFVPAACGCSQPVPAGGGAGALAALALLAVVCRRTR